METGSHVMIQVEETTWFNKPNSKLVSQATVFVFANMDRSSAQIQLKETRTEESDCPRSYYKCTLPQMSG